VTVAALQRKVETLEKAVLKLRFQLESHAPVTVTGANGVPVPVTLSPKQFGARIGRSSGWVRREITHRRIKAYGPPWLIPGSELARFL
jgi:hypothetical protein